MDLFAYILIVVFGCVPPFVVGYWAYKQGKRGEKDALQMRDDAVKEAKNIRDEVVKAVAEVRTQVEGLEIPEPLDVEAVKDDLKLSLTQSLNGQMGNVIKKIDDISTKIEKAVKDAGQSQEMGVPGGGGDKLLMKLMERFI